VDFGSHEGWFKKARRFIYNKEAAEKLEILLEQEKPDIAHLHNISHQLTPSILKPLKKRGIPIVQTLHDYQVICPNYRLYTESEVCERCKKHKYYNCVLHKCVQNSRAASLLAALELKMQWLFRFYKEKVDLFISPSAFLKTKLTEWGVKRPMEVVPNFVDTEKLQPAYMPGNYLICVSRLSEEKGVLTLLEAMQKLPDVQLKLVGDGPQKVKVEKFLKQRQIENVQYLGEKRGLELQYLIRGARFLVLPSEWYENYPMIALEAMALGKPVLAADIGGIPEIVVENATGWLFKSGNAKDLREKIQIHFNDAETIERLGHGARARVEQINCAKTYYEKLMGCYNRVLPEDKKVGMG
jgi:glycosyltransferase involved in cell wall biosynthesis